MVRSRIPSRCCVGALLAIALTGCSGGEAPEPAMAPTPTVDVADATLGQLLDDFGAEPGAGDDALDESVTGTVTTLAVSLGGEWVATVVEHDDGVRRRRTTTARTGLADDQIVAEGEHWIRVVPDVAEATGVEPGWLRLDTDRLAELGVHELPPAGEAVRRAPLVDPADLVPGDVLLGQRVASVDAVDDGYHVTLAPTGTLVVARREASDEAVELPLDEVIDPATAAAALEAARAGVPE